MGALFKVIDASTRDVQIGDLQKARAVVAVAHHAHDADDLRELLAMLGLTASDRYPAARDTQTHMPPATPRRRRQTRRLDHP